MPNTNSTSAPTLRIAEIFHSLQGESSRVGLPTAFIRLTGCPLRCGYCDTSYAFTGGETFSITNILERIAHFNTPYVCVTGGEPLAQKSCLILLTALCDAGYSVSLETSGALPIGDVDTRVVRILDIKTPGSGEVEKNRWENLTRLQASDEIKFVLCDEADYEWAKAILGLYRLNRTCLVLFSPVHGSVDPTQLAEWILRDKLAVRLQVQLHKYLWANTRAR